MPQYPTAPVVTAEISITNGEGNTSQSFVYLNSASDGESQSAEERVTCLSRSVHAADQHTADSAKCTATVSAVLHSARFNPSVPGSSALSPQHSILLLARAPVVEEEGEVGGVDDVIVVEVGGVVGVRAPIAQENG